MKCPYCNEEMLQGIIPCSKGPVAWLPRETTPLLITMHPEEHNGVNLSGTPKLKRLGVIAFNCSKCKKIIIDY